MTAPMMTDNCPAEETLAAFVDDRLDDATRRTVMEHLAACGECRELVLMASDYQAEAPSNVRHGTFGPKRWIAAAAGLAAAAVIGVFVLKPSPFFEPDMKDVMAAADHAKERPFEGRLARFRYKVEKVRLRGDNNKELEEEVVPKGQAELLGVAADLADAKSPDPHVIGVLSLFVEYADPVAELKKAYQSATGDDRDAVAIDYAVALLERGDDKQHDYEQALQRSDEVLKRQQSPEAAWNRAIALMKLQRDDEAIRAWDDFLKLDGTSKWADEAREKRQVLLDAKS